MTAPTRANRSLRRRSRDGGRPALASIAWLEPADSAGSKER
jgi:hypothetical protein